MGDRDGSEGGAGMGPEEVQALFLYGDIIDLPAPEPRSHPRQPRSARAAQFAPFAALTGYGDQVREAARATEARRELSEDEAARIAGALGELARRLGRPGGLSAGAAHGHRDGRPASSIAGRAAVSASPAVRAEVTYFQPDARKEGGSYVWRAVDVLRIDEAAHALVVRPAGCGADAGEEAGGPAARPALASPERIPIDEILDIALPGHRTDSAAEVV